MQDTGKYCELVKLPGAIKIAAPGVPELHGLAPRCVMPNEQVLMLGDKSQCETVLPVLQGGNLPGGGGTELTTTLPPPSTPDPIPTQCSVSDEQTDCDALDVVYADKYYFPSCLPASEFAPSSFKSPRRVRKTSTTSRHRTWLCAVPWQTIASSSHAQV